MKMKVTLIKIFEFNNMIIAGAFSPRRNANLSQFSRTAAKIAIFVIALTLSIASFSPPASADFRAFSERVELSADGGAVSKISLVGDGAAGAMIPCSFQKASSASLGSGPSETALEIRNRGGANFIIVPAGVVQASAPVELTCKVSDAFDSAEASVTDFGNITGKYSFVNSTGQKIGSFEVTVVMPEGFLVNAVDEYQPKLSKNDPNDPFTLSVIGGRRAITLKCSNLKYGDRASLKWRMKSGKRSWGLLLLFLIAAAWYLVVFRDIINPRDHREHGHEKDARAKDLPDGGRSGANDGAAAEKK